jgi:1-acyl-sn-glycerol-3-phosphate acyltransferase
VTFSGDFDKIPREENAFILCNHQSYTDFWAIHTVAQRKSMLSRCRYFAKNSLRYVPLFGYTIPFRRNFFAALLRHLSSITDGRWALMLSGMVMVKRNWDRDRVELERTFAKMKERKWPVCTTYQMSLLSDRAHDVCRRNTTQC